MVTIKLDAGVKEEGVNYELNIWQVKSMSRD